MSETQSAQPRALVRERADRVSEWGPSIFAALETSRAQHPDRPVSAVAAFWTNARGGTSASIGAYAHAGSGAEPHVLVVGSHPDCDVGPVPGATSRAALLLLWPPHEDEPPGCELIELDARDGATARGLAFPSAHGITAYRLALPHLDIVVLQAGAHEPLCPEGTQAVADALHVSRSAPRAVAPADPGAGFDDDAEPTDPAKLGLPTLDPVKEKVLAVRTDDGLLRDVHSGRPLAFDPPLRISLRADELRGAILLGRTARCRGGAELATGRVVSRVHACLLARRDRLWVIDCASRNGTTVANARTGALTVLGPRRRAHALGPHDRVHLSSREVELVLDTRSAGLLCDVEEER
jgi:hypothetical protein